MDCTPIDFDGKFSKFTDLWSPKGVARLNSYIVRLAKVKGVFVWHKHDDTDEAFIVLNGTLRIDFRDRSVEISTGQMLIVPKGIEHKPFAEKICELILIEPENTLNTGDKTNDRTVDTIDWI